MAKPYTGARYTPTPVADYEETFARTSTRLRKAGLYDKAAERWKKFRTALKPPLFPSDPTHFEKRGYWFRTHFPPDEMLSPNSPFTLFDSESATTAPPTSLTPTASETPKNGDETLDPAEALTSPSQADSFTAAEESGSESGPASSDPLQQNPLDNSCKILPTDMTTGVSLEDFSIRAKWAMENAMHVATGRVSIRSSPHAAACWLFTQAALNDPRQFLVSVLQAVERIKKNEIDAYAKVEREKIAAMEKLEAAKAVELNERRSDDRDVSNLLAELGAAEAGEGSRVLQPAAE